MCVEFLYYSRLNKKESIAVLFLRLVAGSAFVLHGLTKIQKPFNWMGEDASIPAIFQALAALSEFGGGIAWILGLLTPLASFGMACTMAFATFFHASKGDPFVGHGGSFEPALGYFAIAIVLLMIGPGRFSLDHLLFGAGKEAA